MVCHCIKKTLCKCMRSTFLVFTLLIQHHLKLINFKELTCSCQWRKKHVKNGVYVQQSKISPPLICKNSPDPLQKYHVLVVQHEQMTYSFQYLQRLHYGASNIQLPYTLPSPQRVCSGLSLDDPLKFAILEFSPFW